MIRQHFRFWLFCLFSMLVAKTASNDDDGTKLLRAIQAYLDAKHRQFDLPDRRRSP